MIVEESPHIQSGPDVRSSQLLVRTGQIFKKVSHFRGSRRKSESKDLPGKYSRSTRSMDLASKPYIDVGAHHSMELDSESFPPSSNGYVTAVASTSQTGLVASDAIHHRSVSGGTLSVHTRSPVPDGLPQSQQSMWQLGKAEEARAGEAQQPLLLSLRENGQPANPHSIQEYHPSMGKSVGVAASFVPSEAQAYTTDTPDQVKSPQFPQVSQMAVETERKAGAEVQQLAGQVHSPAETLTDLHYTHHTLPPPPIEKDAGTASRTTISHFREPAHTAAAGSSQSSLSIAEALHISPRPVHSVPSIAPLEADVSSEDGTRRPLRLHTGQASEGSPLSFGKRETQDHTTRTLPSRKLSLSEASALIFDGASSLSERRSLAPRLATLPPPMMARYNASGAARLSPAMVTRQAPMPILNLPTLSLPSPTLDARPGRTQAPLRSIPALPMQGPSQSDQEADHENAELVDSDSEDDGEDDMDTSVMAREGDAGASDDEDTEDISETGLSGRSRIGPSVLLSQMDASASLNAETAGTRPSTVYHTPSADFQPTPLARPVAGSSSVDYFSAKDTGRQSPSQTPRPSDFRGGAAARTPNLGNGPLRTPMLQGSPRPGKDVIGFPARGGADSIVEKRRSRLIRDGPPTILEDEHGTPHPHLEPPEESILAPPTLRRQRSLPTYKVSSDPPPYPSFHPRAGFNVQPRDEEGYEWLPSYSNSVYLAAVMPRKLEFSQPGVQARDRKWRRVLCVLEGTVFKVYKCPSGVAGVSAIEQWWERKVGVGDIATGGGTTVTASGVRVTAVRERPRDADSSSKPTDTDSPVSPALQEASANSSRSQAPVADPPTRSKFRGLLRPTRSSFSALTRPNVDIPRESRRLSSPPISTRQSSDTNSSRSVVSSGYASNSTSRTTITTPSSSSDGSFFFSRNRGHAASGPSDIPATSMKELPEPDPKELIRSYTLQRAESGLASDYIKRKNVVRVRMEGEQFLLQAQDVAGVISWIENIQAATNIALDLDERPMPKGPMFPRRRRRRIRAVQDHNTTRSLTIAAEPRTASG